MTSSSIREQMTPPAGGGGGGGGAGSEWPEEAAFLLVQGQQKKVRPQRANMHAEGFGPRRFQGTRLPHQRGSVTEAQRWLWCCMDGG